MRLILASASPARLAVLRSAGVEPVVRVSGVDEDAITAGLADPTPAQVVTALAAAKADAVLDKVAVEYPDAVVIGCDSMLSMTGPDGPELVGKPGTVDLARARWRAMAGGEGTLLTGHAVVRLTDGGPTARATDTRSTIVRFGRPTDRELDAYLASGEPVRVAGGFTLDGLGGWFVEGVDGDPSSVIGISLPLTRTLLARVGLSVADLWAGDAAAGELDDTPGA
ncbi:MAG TPA: Maf family nucleotide pyrophosphatase [Pseudonocardiaceae bacterium]